MAFTRIELPEELHAQAQALAETTGRTIEDVLAEAVAQGLAHDRWFRTEVERGRRSAAADRFAAPAEVEAMWMRVTTPEALAEAEAELG